MKTYPPSLVGALHFLFPISFVTLPVASIGDMESLTAEQREIQITAERHLKFLGTAKVNLDEISFDLHSHRQLDQRNIDRLCDIFYKEQCQNLTISHRIPAIVSRNHLTAALENALPGVTAQSLRTSAESELPHLKFLPGQLQGLHGRHRVVAGSKVLTRGHRWWAVDLYLDDIGDDLRTTLIEEHSNEQRPNDGEIYHKIRQYVADGNRIGELRWRARLSPSCQSRLDALAKNARLQQAFDSVLQIPGNRTAMSISMLHRVLAVKCDEEIAHYLNYVKEFWFSLVDNDPLSIAKIDQRTVETLQLMAPCAEAESVQGLVLSGQIFSDLGAHEREAILTRLQLFTGIVPSLHTFFDDFKCFESWAHCLTRLSPCTRSTVRLTMKGLHASSSNNICMIQTSEYTFSERAISADEQFEVAYRQLWLYAMRHYPQMPRDPKRKERLARPRSATANERVVSGMGHLAHQLGFDSSEIQELIGQAPDRLIARNALLQARDPESFEVDDATVDSIIGHIITCFDMIRPKGVVTVPPTRVSRSVPRKSRSGHPTLKALVQDRALLFLDHIHTAAVPDLVTTAFVRHCVYFAFFGPHPAVSQAANSVYCPTPPLFVPESRPSQIHPDQDSLQHMSNNSPGFGQPIETWNYISPSMDVDHNRSQNHTTAGPVAERRPSRVDTECTREEAEFQESTSHAVQGFHHQMTTDNMTHQQASSTMVMYATELGNLPNRYTKGAINAIREPCTQKGGDLYCEPMEELSNDNIAAGAINNTHQLNNNQRAQTHRKNILRNSYTGKINIVFYVYDEHSQWNVTTIVQVNPADPSSTSEFRQTVQRYKQQGITLCDIKMRSVSISSSLSAAMADGQNVLLLFPPGTRRLCQSPAIPKGLPVPGID